jgi:hypothetical protein
LEKYLEGKKRRFVNYTQRIMSLKKLTDSQNVRKKKKHRLQKRRKPEKNSRIRNRKQRNMIWNFNTKHEKR